MIPALILIPTNNRRIYLFFFSLQVTLASVSWRIISFFFSTSKGEGEAGVPYEMWKQGIGLCSLDCVGLECSAPECPYEEQRMNLMLSVTSVWLLLKWEDVLLHSTVSWELRSGLYRYPKFCMDELNPGIAKEKLWLHVMSASCSPEQPQEQHC